MEQQEKKQCPRCDWRGVTAKTYCHDCKQDNEFVRLDVVLPEHVEILRAERHNDSL